MRRSELLFQFIDTVWHPMQNYRRYSKITRVPNIVYDESRPKVCTAEYYFDAELMKEKKLPAVLYIHGGGFVRGDKKHRKSFCKMYADNGYFVMNINYALGPKEIFPQGSIDCVNALNYLTKAAEEYNIDLEKICVTGDSAGGFYAAHIVALSNNAELREKLGVPEFKVRPTVLVGDCGMYNPPASVSMLNLPFHYVWDIGDSFLGRRDGFALKKNCSNVEEYPLIKEVNPSNYVVPEWQPSFLVISTNDMFCPGQGELLQSLLIENGVEVEVFFGLSKNDIHCFPLDMFRKSSKLCVEKMIAFMDKHLK